MDLNKVMLIGNLVADPEYRSTTNGQNIANFRIATNRRWKDQTTGELKEDTQFHRIIAWGKLGEVCSRYIKKGMKVYIEGHLQTRSWDDNQTGQKKYSTEIVAENMIMLDRKSSLENNSQKNNNSIESEDFAIPAPEQIPTINVDENQEEIKIEDIPF